MSDMSDFEQAKHLESRPAFEDWLNRIGVFLGISSLSDKLNAAEAFYAGIEWQAAKQSMQGEAKFSASDDADRLRSIARGMSYNDMSEATWKHVILEIAMRLDTGGYSTHAPDSAARIAKQSAEIARLQKELEEARKALQFYADGDHYRRILPWLQEDNWRESLKKSGWVHLSTERDDEEYWVEGGQIADAAVRQSEHDASLNIKGGAE